jgi:hypothetical protein
MALTLYYCTKAQVRACIVNISTSVTDDDIEEFIRRSENFLDLIMGKSFKQVYDADKHAVLTDFVAARSAYMALAADPSSMSDNPEAALSADLFFTQVEELKTILSDPQKIKYLENL